MNCCKLPVSVNLAQWVKEFSFIDIYRQFLENCFMLEKEDGNDFDYIEKVDKATNTQIYYQPKISKDSDSDSSGYLNNVFDNSERSVSSDSSYDIIEE